MAINVKDKLVTLESLGVAYSAEQDAREEADQALSTRIDNIVAPDGDPSLTEVSDARVSGSTTYNTLKARLDADKAAIGTEISQLSADLGSLMEPQRLADGTDFNSVTTPGTYTLHVSCSYTNKPTADAEHGILEVWHEDYENNLGRVFQMLIYTYKAGRTCTEIWTRSLGVATMTWTPWVSVVNVDDLNRNSLLLNEVIPDTTQSYTFTNGRISQIVHSRNSSAVRTDSFTYETGTITEVRTLASGESLTIVTNLTTLETTITYTEA